MACDGVGDDGRRRSDQYQRWGPSLHRARLGRPGGRADQRGPIEADERLPFSREACLAIPRRTWIAAGGFPTHFFMYGEDVDLSLRLRLVGGHLGIVPRAVVVHDYRL